MQSTNQKQLCAPAYIYLKQISLGELEKNSNFAPINKIKTI